MSNTNKMPDNNGKKYNKNKVDTRIYNFKKYYTDPTSNTFQNVLQSALKAGYAQQYSENLSHLNPKWFSEMQQDSELLRAKMLAKSEKHFNAMLDVPSDTNDKERLKLKQQTAVHISESLGKDLYSKRQELTDKGGRKLFTNQTQSREEINVADLFAGVQESKQ
jgi:HD superfamily phosphohydrolase